MLDEAAGKLRVAGLKTDAVVKEAISVRFRLTFSDLLPDSLDLYI
jgi:hypothetical protein